jgi:hypothetical protein
MISPDFICYWKKRCVIKNSWAILMCTMRLWLTQTSISLTSILERLAFHRINDHMCLWSLVAPWHSYILFKKEIVIFTIVEPLKYKIYSLITSIGGRWRLGPSDYLRGFVGIFMVLFLVKFCIAPAILSQMHAQQDSSTKYLELS